MKSFLLPCLLLSLSLSAETVYKSVDAEGNVIFSDQPSAGAEEIQVRQPDVLQTEPLKLQDSSTERAAESLVPYTELAIRQPANDSTVHSNPGNLDVAVILLPELLDTHQLLLEMDGKSIASGAAKQFQLANIDRGTHDLVVHVVTAEGKKLISSDPVTVHLRRHSKLSARGNGDNPTVTPLNPPRGSPEGTSVVPGGISPTNPSAAQTNPEQLPPPSL